MKTHRFASHTPEEKRRLSNQGHIMEGLILGAVGVLALMDAFGVAPWTKTAWPILLLIAGLLLLGLLYSRHPFEDWQAIWRDAQQRQHTIIASAILLGGAAELWRSSRAAWAFVWPAVATLIGVLFLTHAQHGTGKAVVKAVWQHRILGVTIMVAGLSRLAEVITGANILSILWPLALLAAATQLILYREPAGAFEGDHGHHS